MAANVGAIFYWAGRLSKTAEDMDRRLARIEQLIDRAIQLELKERRGG